MKVKDYFISESHNLFCILLIKITVNVNIHLCLFSFEKVKSLHQLDFNHCNSASIILLFGLVRHYITLLFIGVEVFGVVGNFWQTDVSVFGKQIYLFDPKEKNLLPRSQFFPIISLKLHLHLQFGIE